MDECLFCGANEDLHKHHIIPKSLGGINQRHNLTILCRNCHQKLHIKILNPIIYHELQRYTFESNWKNEIMKDRLKRILRDVQVLSTGVHKGVHNGV